jgi:hypothetical protein
MIKKIYICILVFFIIGCNNEIEKERNIDCTHSGNKFIFDIYEGMHRDCFDKLYPNLRNEVDLKFPDFDHKFYVTNAIYENDRLIAVQLETESFNVNLLSSEIYKKEDGDGYKYLNFSYLQIAFLAINQGEIEIPKITLNTFKEERGISGLFNISEIEGAFKEKYKMKYEKLHSRGELSCNYLPKKTVILGSEVMEIDDIDRCNENVGEPFGSVKYYNKSDNGGFETARELIKLYADNKSGRTNSIKNITRYALYYDETKYVKIYPVVNGIFPFNLEKKLVVLYYGNNYINFLKKMKQREDEEDRKSKENIDKEIEDEKNKKEQELKEAINNI